MSGARLAPPHRTSADEWGRGHRGPGRAPVRGSKRDAGDPVPSHVPPSVPTMSRRRSMRSSRIETNHWSTPVWAFCSGRGTGSKNALTLCLSGLFCWPCILGKVNAWLMGTKSGSNTCHYITLDCPWHLGCLCSCSWRRDMRTRYRIPPNTECCWQNAPPFAEDMCVHFLCGPCVACQEWRELHIREPERCVDLLPPRFWEMRSVQTPGTAPGTTAPGTTAPRTTAPGTTSTGTTSTGTTAPGTESELEMAPEVQSLQERRKLVAQLRRGPAPARHHIDPASLPKGAVLVQRKEEEDPAMIAAMAEFRARKERERAAEAAAEAAWEMDEVEEKKKQGEEKEKEGEEKEKEGEEKKTEEEKTTTTTKTKRQSKRREATSKSKPQIPKAPSLRERRRERKNAQKQAKKAKIQHLEALHEKAIEDARFEKAKRDEEKEERRRIRERQKDQKRLGLPVMPETPRYDTDSDDGNETDPEFYSPDP